MNNVPCRPPSLACHRAEIRGRQISPIEWEILPQHKACERSTQQFLGHAANN
jgi:hypothetical protein